MVTREFVIKFIMKRFFLFLLLFGVTFFCYSQTIEWSTTWNWKIYKLNNKNAFYYPVDTLVNFESAPMNDSAVILFLSHAVVWPKGKAGTWMGLYIGTYETADKELRKVIFSSYGGFLFESASRQYYELPRNLRQEWNNFLIGNLQKVFGE